MANDEVVTVDESMTMTFQDVKRDPDSIDVEEMTFGSIKKMLQAYTNEKADFKTTIDNNLNKIQKLEREKEDCRNNLVCKNQELDVARSKLKEMTKLGRNYKVKCESLAKENIEYKKVTESVEKLKKENESLSMKVTDLESKNEQWKAWKRKNLKDARDKWTKEKENLTKKMALLEQTIASKDVQLAISVVASEGYKREASDKTAENESLKSKLSEYSKENLSLKALAQSNANQKQKINTLQQEKEKLSACNQELEAANGTLKRKIEDMKQERDGLKEKVRRTMEDSLDASIKNLFGSPGSS